MRERFEQIPWSVLGRTDLSPVSKLVYAFMRPLVAKGVPVGQRFIGDRCGISKSSVVKAQKELVNCDPPLLERIPGASGRRAVFALVTAPSDPTDPPDGPVTPSTALDTRSTGPVTRPTEAVTPATGLDCEEPTGHPSSPKRSHVRPVGQKAPVTPSTGTGHTFDHHRSHPRPEAVTPSTTSIPQTNYQTNQTEDAGARVDARPPPDLSTASGRWRHFELAWMARFGGIGMGGYDGRRALELKATLSTLTPEQWVAEVDAYLEAAELKRDTDGWFPQDPWTQLRKHLGQWQVQLDARRSAAAKKAKREAAAADRNGRGRRVLDDERPKPKLAKPVLSPELKAEIEAAQREVAEIRGKAKS